MVILPFYLIIKHKILAGHFADKFHYRRYVDIDKVKSDLLLSALLFLGMRFRCLKSIRLFFPRSGSVSAIDSVTVDS